MEEYSIPLRYQSEAITSSFISNIIEKAHHAYTRYTIDKKINKKMPNHHISFVKDMVYAARAHRDAVALQTPKD